MNTKETETQGLHGTENPRSEARQENEQEQKEQGAQRTVYVSTEQSDGRRTQGLHGTGTFWLIKSEPSTWSWEDQIRKGTEPWNGVRNYQARNNLRAMNVGDLCFFYHSVKERCIVGIVEVASPYRLDPTDPDGVFGLVDVKTVCAIKKPICLDQIKLVPPLQNMALLKQSRLSVQPVMPDEWHIILQLSGDEE